jgi:superfamily II DNA or RNA helicase
VTAQLSWFEQQAAPMLRDVPVDELATFGAIVPRPYQQAGAEATERELLTHRSTLNVLATGTGKAVMAAFDAKRATGVVVFCAHEESLLEQAAQKIRHITGEVVATEKAERRAAPGYRFVVASVQTLRGDRLADFKRRFPDVERLIFDECHRSEAPTYRNIAATWPGAKLIGYTATPDRGDKRALALYESVAFRYDIFDAVGDGWLTEGDVLPINVDGVRLDDVPVCGDDLDQSVLDGLVAVQAGQIARVADPLLAGERSLFFTPGVDTAVVGAAALNELRAGCAKAIHGKMPDWQKRQIKREHRNGEFPYLLNCLMLMEGYDDQRIVNIVYLGKTKSRARWAQIYGRGGRLWPTVDWNSLPSAADRLAAIASSPKPRFRFFDAHYGKHRHTLAGPIEALAGDRFPPEVVKRAADAYDPAKGGDPLELLEDAARAWAEKLRRSRQAAARKAASALGDVRVGNPVPREQLYGGEPVEVEPGLFVTKLDLVGWLRKQGAHEPHLWSEADQRKWRRIILDRNKAGLGSLKQAKALKKAGVPDAYNVSKGRCGLILGKLNGRRFDPASDGWMLGPGVTG